MIRVHCDRCENCIHVQMCKWAEEMVDNHTCDWYREERPHGEWFGTVCTNCGESTSFYYDCNYCPQCGASMRVKDELNRVSKELNSKTEYKAKVKELENAIAKCEKAEEEFKKRTCKFKSPTNCDFCAFHSGCEEHWREGEAEC